MFESDQRCRKLSGGLPARTRLNDNAMPRMPLFPAKTPHPPASVAAPAAAQVDPPPHLTTPDHALVGQIGAELSGFINTVQGILHDLNHNPQMSPRQLQLLATAVASASDIARQSQQISRLAEGHVRQSHERIHLDALLHQAVQERIAALEAQGVDLHCNIKHVEVIVDPGLLFTLIDSALNWACASSQRLAISLGTKNWPEHAVLTIRTTAPAGATRPVPGPDPLSWHLMCHIAQAMEVTVEREVRDNGDAILRMEFSRTVRVLEGLTSMDMDEATGGDSTFYTNTKPLTGSRVLLISRDPLVRGEVDRACRLLSLKVDTVPGVPQAERYVKLGMPQLLIIDERQHDDAFDRMLHEIRETDPDFGVLEITDDADTFEISSWMSESMTRVSRALLRAQLPAVITRELARAL